MTSREAILAQGYTDASESWGQALTVAAARVICVGHLYHDGRRLWGPMNPHLSPMMLQELETRMAE